MSDRLYGAADKAPRYLQHRHLVGVVDTLPETNEKHGISCEDYEYAHIQVVPSGGANPVVKVLFWSEGAAAFVPDHAGIDFTAFGVDTSWEASVSVRSRKMFVAVTSGVSGVQVCRVFVAGYRNGSR